MSGKWYIIDDVNPQPWAIGPLGMGRKAGRTYPYVGPNQQLVVFQRAIREQLADLEPPNFPGDVELEFYLWRQIETYQGRGRKQSGHQSDATNIQKALEDALQGFLFANDRAVRSIRTVVVEQSQTTHPRIVIRARPWQDFDPAQIPDFIWHEIDKTPSLVVVSRPNIWGSDEEVF